MTVNWNRVFCLFLALVPGPAMALDAAGHRETYDEAWRWSRFTTEQGLPSNNVLRIIETADGTPWAWTTRGLAWYDEFRWWPADSSIGLPLKSTSNVEPDPRGGLVVTVDGKVYTGDQHGFHALPFRDVWQAFPFSPDTLVMIIRDTPYVYSNGDLRLFRSLLQITRTKFPLLLGSSKLGIWFEGGEGVYKWLNNAWDLEFRGNGALGSAFSQNENGSGLMYVGGVWKLWEWTSAFPPRENTSQAPAYARAVAIDPDGNALLVTDFAQTRIRVNNSWSILNSRIADIHNVTALLFSKNRDLWVSTENGLFRYNSSSSRWANIQHFPASLGNLVNEIVRDRAGRLWLGTAGGVDILSPNGSMKTIDEVNGTKISAVTGVAEDSAGNIWISSGSGFMGSYRWNGSRWDRFKIREDSGSFFIHKIVKDRRGRLWFLGISPTEPKPGAYLLDNGMFVHWGTKEGLPSGHVYAFSEDSSGSFWFGTKKGVGRWRPSRGSTGTRPAEGTWTYWGPESTWQSGFTLAVDGNNGVWFSDQVSGLYHLTENGSIARFTTSDGLIGDRVWNIRVDQAGGLWIATRSGLNYYHNGIWSGFDQKSGLSNPVVWPLLCETDKLYAGTSGGGVAVLNLRESHQPPPKISIDTAFVAGATVRFKWRVFPYHGSQAPEDVLTRWRVDDADWSRWDAAKESHVDELSPGPHSIQVQAAGLFGAFDAPGARRSFSIALPFYRHPVFVVPVSALTVTVVILGISLIVRKRKHTAALQESELKFRRLTEAAFEGIAIHNRGIILDANQRLLDMFGYAYEEFVGKSVVEFSAPESYDLVWTKMHTESETMYEAACLKKGGAKILVEIIGKTIPHQEGIAHVIAVRDITERKEAERRLLEYQSQLQSLASQLSLTEERERRRMAEFLHEYIVQSLALCKIKLEGPAERAAPAEQAKSREEICALLDGMIRNTRSLTFELSPPILHELDFEDALEWLAEQMQEQHSIEVSFEDDGEPKPVTHDTRILLFHATRELLFNVVKHARASRAVLSVRRCDPNILLAVADDGAGFVPSQGRGLDTRKGGFGLFNIRERLAFIGGRMEIESKPGAGTKITLIAPISETVDPNPGGGS